MPRLSHYCLILPLIACMSPTDPTGPSIETHGGAAYADYGDFLFQARGFDRFEGRMVHLRLGNPRFSGLGDERETFARARVAGGGFRFSLPDAREIDLYKWYGVYFDADGDGKCASGKDEGYLGATGAGDLYVDSLEQWKVRPADSTVCAFMDQS